MPLVEEKYDQGKVDSLKRYLQREADKGRPRDYEVVIDGFKVLSRTDNIEEFEDFEQEIKDTTRNISILIYDGKSTNRNTRYSFLLHGDNSLPLSGTGGGGLGAVDQLIQTRLDEKDREYALKALKDQLAEAEQLIKEGEKYQDQLEKELAHLKANKYNLGGLDLVELGSFVLKHTITSHAPTSPLAAQMAGILGALSGGEGSQTPTSEPEGEASFRELSADAPQSELTEHQQLILQSVQQMEQVFNSKQLMVMNQVIVTLMQRPSELMTIAGLLNIKI